MPAAKATRTSRRRRGPGTASPDDHDPRIAMPRDLIPLDPGHRPTPEEHLLARLEEDMEAARRDGRGADLARLYRQAQTLQQRQPVVAEPSEESARLMAMSTEELNREIELLEASMYADDADKYVHDYCTRHGLELRRMGTGELVYRPGEG